LKRNSLLIYTLLILLFSCSDELNERKMEEEYNSKIETFIETCWNKQDLTKIESIFSNDYTRKLNNVQIVSNPKELRDNMHVFFKGFPDLSIVVNSSITKNNHVVLKWTLTGTNTGVFGEVQATGKKVKVNGFSKILFNEAGKIEHEDIYYNELDFLQQLGYTLIPPNTE